MTVFSLPALFDQFKINSYNFQLSENLVSTRDGGGQMLVSSIGPRVWKGSIALSATSTSQARKLNVLLQQIQRPENSFYVFDKANGYPVNYKAGDAIANIRIVSPVAGYNVNLSGFPANYKLSAGDYFSLIKGGVSLLFQITEDISADAAGVVAGAKILHPLPIGITSLTAVTMIKPVVSARYVPNSMKIGANVLGYTEGANFDWVQTFKI